MSWIATTAGSACSSPSAQRSEVEIRRPLDARRARRTAKRVGVGSVYDRVASQLVEVVLARPAAGPLPVALTFCDDLRSHVDVSAPTLPYQRATLPE
jgi:hypothetical protein